MDKTSRKRGFKKRVYGWLWLVAFLPRFALALVFFDHSIALDDLYQYDMLARSLLQGNGYRWYGEADFEKLRPYYERFLDVEDIQFPEEGLRTAHRAPGYPLFLSGVYAVVPASNRFGWTRLIQAALTAGLAPLCALIAIHSGLGKKTALISGISMALYPILLFYPLALASENLFLPTLTAGFLFLLLIPTHAALKYPLLSGLFLTWSTLTRSVVALFHLVSAAWMRIFHRTKIKHIALFLALALLFTLPWAVRNSRLMGKPTFLETSLGYNLYISYHPEGNGGFISRIAIEPLAYVEDQARDQFATQQALQFIKDDPGDALLRVFRKMAFFFGLEDREMTYFYGNGFLGDIPQPWRWTLYILLILPWLGVGFLTPLGMVLSENRPAVWLTLGLLFSYAVPHFLIIAEPRFHLALVPLLLPYAAHAWTQRRKIHSLLSPSKSGRWTTVLTLGWWIFFSSLIIWHISLHRDILLRVMGPEGNQLHIPY
ncbi:MAG: hypothetical protein R6U57_11980 [Anaerolineales bacterium]